MRLHGELYGVPRLRGELRGLPLTVREVELFAAVINDGPKAAAHALGISRHTANSAVWRVCQKIGARNKTHAAALLYFRLGHLYMPQSTTRPPHEGRPPSSSAIERAAA